MVPLAHRPVPPRLSLLPRGLALLTMMVLVLAVPPPGAARADGPRWQWPTPSPHAVVARFEAPATPYGPGHRGIDIAADGGVQIRAVEAGTVRFSGSLAGRGVVSVVHADGLLSTYEPVTSTLSEGERVAAGDVLGTLEGGSPSSHCGAQDCLHLGARRGESYLDPLLLLGGRGPSVLLPWEGGGIVGTPAEAPVAPGGASTGSASAGVVPAGSAAPGPSPVLLTRPVVRLQGPGPHAASLI
jgi:hypothetical protein